MLACDCKSRTFFIMNFLNFLRWEWKSWKTTVWDSNDSNKTGMGFALSQDLFYFGFFVAAAEFRLGFGRCIGRVDVAVTCWRQITSTETSVPWEDHKPRCSMQYSWVYYRFNLFLVIWTGNDNIDRFITQTNSNITSSLRSIKWAEVNGIISIIL